MNDQSHIVANNYRANSRIIPIALALLWAGMVVGVSFIATPAKFLAPSLTQATAFDVGRATFHIFTSIEMVLALLLLLAVALFHRHAVAGLIAAVLLGIVAAETLYLLPQLDLRVTAILAGEDLPPSSLHSAYVILEAAKLILLLAMAWHVSRRLLTPGLS